MAHRRDVSAVRVHTNRWKARAMAIPRILTRLGEIVLPSSCGGCGLPGEDLCAACIAQIWWRREPVCRGCGQVVDTPETVHRCGDCRGRPILFADHAAAYDGPVANAISELKDRGRSPLARVLAEIVVQRVARPDSAVLVPVPLDRRRARTRGFNQAERIATALGELWELPVVHALERTRPAVAQRGASRTDRLRQVAGAFTAIPVIPTGRLVIIDDVHTTGATLAACARALRRSGATTVAAITVARVWPSYIRR